MVCYSNKPINRKEDIPTNSQKMYIWKMLVESTKPNIEKVNNDKNEK